MDKINLNYKTLLVTGAAGFIGSNLVKRLLRDVKGATIIGIDNINDYYDVRLKEYRLSELNKSVPKGTIWEFIKSDIADRGNIDDIFSNTTLHSMILISTRPASSYLMPEWELSCLHCKRTNR